MEQTKNRMTLNILGHSFKISAGTRLDKDFTLPFYVTIDNGYPETFHKANTFVFDVLLGKKNPTNIVLDIEDYTEIFYEMFHDAALASDYANVFDFIAQMQSEMERCGDSVTQDDADYYMLCEHNLNILVNYFDVPTIKALEEAVMKGLTPLDK